MQLDESQIQRLTDVVNIGATRAALVLNQIIDAHVELSIPQLKLVAKSELAGELPVPPDETVSSVELPFTGDMTGSASLLFPLAAAATLVKLLLADAGPADLDAEKIGTLTEVGNMVLNGIMGSIVNLCGDHLDYSVPRYTEARPDQLLAPVMQSDASCLVAQTRFEIEQHGLDGKVFLFFELEHIARMLEKLPQNSPSAA